MDLRPMTEDEFRRFIEVAIPAYANDHVKAGNWDEHEALDRAQREFDQLLPDGLGTKDHYLFMVVEGETDESVGVLWFAIRRRGARSEAFIYDVEIFEQYRRRGYASEAFQALEGKAQELGFSAISLHVFGDNLAARGLYEKLGFITTNVLMSKPLGE